MEKVYKQIAECQMCRTRFVVENNKKNYRSITYCADCYNKYFNK